MEMEMIKKRHLAAPFDLRGTSDRLGDKENFEYFNAAFPNNNGYTHDGLFLYIHLETPPQPPPKSFAGVPVIFVAPSDTFLSPVDYALPTGFWVPRRQGSIAGHLDYRGKEPADWSPLFEAIQLHFDHIKVPISEVIYFGLFVYIVLEDDDTDEEHLPQKAANLTCRYLYESDLKRPAIQQAHYRAKDPRQGQVDDTTDNILRPGVRVSSEYVPGSQAFYSTTLGARVQDSDGVQYITVAAHGFPAACGTAVYHAVPHSGRVAGQVVGRVGKTDVALMRLSAGEPFTHAAFPSDTDGASRLLCGLRTPRMGDIVFLHSPDAGVVDGQVMGSAKRKLSVDGDTDAPCWVTHDWVFHGTDLNAPFPKSMCGAAAYGEDGRVVSFFQYAFHEGPLKGWCVGTSAEELLERGFR